MAGASPDQAAAKLSWAWRTAVKRLRRAGIGGRIDYLAVFEKTKQGWPHLHILLRSGFIPQRTLSTLMGELTASPMVWITKVDDPRKAARYLAKYIGKDPHRFATCKRYWSTPGYHLDQPEDSEREAWSEYTWEKRTVDIREIWRVWTFEGKSVRTDLDEYAMWGQVPWSLARRWEKPPDGQSEGSSLGEAIGSAACAPPQAVPNPSLGCKYRGGPGAASPGGAGA